MKRPVALFAIQMSVCTAFAELPTPVIHWSMDNVDPARPASAPSLGSCETTLEWNGGPVSVIDNGAVGKALWFDGSHWSYAFSGKAIRGLQSRTLSFWVYCNDRVGDFGVPTGSIMLFNNVSAMQVQMNVADAAGELFSNNDVWFWTGSYYTSMNRRPRLTPGVWTHFAWSIDVKSTEGTGADAVYRSVVRLYQNGVCIFVDENAELTGLESEKQWFVGTSESVNKPMTGGLDEIKVWDVALTDAQVAEEFARATDVPKTRLLCGFDFDQVESDGNGGLVVPNQAGFGDAYALKAPAAVTVSDGPGGKALHFDGTSATGASTKVPFAMAESTVAFWCRVEKDDNYSNNPPFFHLGSHMMGVVASIGRSYMPYMLKYQLTANNQLEVDPGYVGRDGWQHFVIVRRHRWEESLGKAVTVGEIWYNGVKIHGGDLAKAQNADYTIPNETLTLGAENDFNFRLNGDLKDFYLFAGALTDEEIVRLYRGPAEVDAGTDFSVAGETAVLRGFVGSRSGTYLKGYDGEVRWSLVSAPAGGEGAAFLRPGNPETEVTLPVVGDYEFRLETRGLVANRADTVRVSRIASAGAAPTVSAAGDVSTVELPGGAWLTATVAEGTSVAWSKVSGDGAVWFDPANAAKTVCRFAAPGTYVLRATALKDGATASADVTCTVVAAPAGTGLETGLLHRWEFDGLPGSTYKDAVASLEVANYDFAKIGIGAGVCRAGLATRDTAQGAELGTYVTALHEDYDGSLATDYEIPKDEWRTFSLWAWQDKSRSEAERHYAPCILSERLSLWCTLNRYLDPATDGLQQTPGITIQQWGINGIHNSLWYPAPYSFTNRWTHFVFQINRRDTSQCELWIDGVKQTPAASNLVKYWWGSLEGQYSGGRVVAQSLMLGGINYKEADYTTEPNMAFSVAKDASGNFYSRTFPGNLDDVRIYGRKLTEGEIRYLAQNPDLDANLAPAVSAASVPDEVYCREAVGVSADGVAYGKGPAPVAYEWQVVGGDASKVVFADRTARETQATFLAKGTYRILLEVTDGERVTYGEPRDVEVAGKGLCILLK